MTCTNDHYGPVCELPDDHEGPHRNGLLVWHDPPLLIVGSSDDGEESARSS